MERAWNRHHAFSERAWYRTPAEKQFRCMAGLIVPMYVPIHADLHANLNHPPKPNTRLLQGAIQFMDNLPVTITREPVEAITALADHFGEQDDHLANRIAQNLDMQLVYIKDGLYEV